MAKNSVGCIVLAAGSAVRFGSPKQLAELNGKPLVKNAIEVANGSSADYVIVVIGNHSSEILEKIDLGRAQLVYNKDFETGIASSIKCGIANLPDDSLGAIVMVADQPYLESKHLDQMIAEFRKAPTKSVVLSFQGKQRNPVLLPRSMFRGIEKLDGDMGAKDLVRNSPHVAIEISDARVFFDVDTKDSLLELQSKEKD